MGSIGDLKKNPARELVKTAGLTVVDGAMGAIGGKINIGAEKISNKVIVDFCFYVFCKKIFFYKVIVDGTKLLAESGLATASKSVTQVVAKGSSTAVKKVVLMLMMSVVLMMMLKVVNTGLKFAGKTATDALAEGAEKLASQSKLKEEATSFSKLEKLVAGVARQPSGQLTPI